LVHPARSIKIHVIREFAILSEERHSDVSILGLADISLQWMSGLDGGQRENDKEGLRIHRVISHVPF